MAVRLALCALFVAGTARADATHISALATGGFWITGHGYGEKDGGLEGTVERDLGSVYRVGAGISVHEYKINDDECYGSTGQLARVFASAGLREPTADTVHVFVAIRFGFAGARMVPSCYPQEPVRYETSTFGLMVAGADIGRGPTRVRVQSTVRHTFEPNAPVEVELGVGVSF